MKYVNMPAIPKMHEIFILKQLNIDYICSIKTLVVDTRKKTDW